MLMNQVIALETFKEATQNDLKPCQRLRRRTERQVLCEIDAGITPKRPCSQARLTTCRSYDPVIISATLKTLGSPSLTILDERRTGTAQRHSKHHAQAYAEILWPDSCRQQDQIALNNISVVSQTRQALTPKT